MTQSIDKAKALMALRRQHLQNLAELFRDQIEAADLRTRGPLPPEGLIRALCTYVAADFSIFLDGKLPEDIEITDDKRMLLGLEIYCTPDLAKRKALAGRLQQLVYQHVISRYHEILTGLGIPTEEGMHVNLLHRVSAYVDYSEDDPHRPTEDEFPPEEAIKIRQSRSAESAMSESDPSDGSSPSN